MIIKKKIISLFALSLAVFSLSACSSIDKALYSITDSITTVDRVTGERSLNMVDRDQQIVKSNQMAEAFLQENYFSKDKAIDEDLSSFQYKRLKNVFDRVHQVSHMRDEEWKVVLLPDRTFNAFVMGGTYVFVHKELMEEVKSDAELAYILGHEIAHVAANHVYETQSYNLGATLAGSNSVERGSFQAAYTHNNEEEADRIGLLYAALAGYDPVEASNVWVRMGQKKGQNAAFFNTHPIAKERAATNEKLADLYKQYYMPGQINPNYKEILAQLNRKSQSTALTGEADVATEAETEAGAGAGIKALFESALDVFVTRTENKVEERRQAERVVYMRTVEQDLRVLDTLLKSEDDIFSVMMIYIGDDPIQELTLKSFYKDQVAITKIDKVLSSRQKFLATFEFPADTLKNASLSELKVGIDYAEPANQAQ